SQRGEDSTFEVPPGSEQERRIVNWFKAHDSGWSGSIDTYAPTLSLRGVRSTNRIFDLIA
ncbi:MAG TPA: hypothetical protein VHE81_20550, partial [Lacipirellulaceae bacterium]|nr:hypothetical protein [Lacipirellulaceae bacterium]